MDSPMPHHHILEVERLLSEITKSVQDLLENRARALDHRDGEAAEEHHWDGEDWWFTEAGRRNTEKLVAADIEYVIMASLFQKSQADGDAEVESFRVLNLGEVEYFRVLELCEVGLMGRNPPHEHGNPYDIDMRLGTAVQQETFRSRLIEYYGAAVRDPAANHNPSDIIYDTATGVPMIGSSVVAVQLIPPRLSRRLMIPLFGENFNVHTLKTPANGLLLHRDVAEALSKGAIGINNTTGQPVDAQGIVVRMIDLEWRIMDENAPILDRVILLGPQNPHDGKPLRIRELDGQKLKFVNASRPRPGFVCLQGILYHLKRRWMLEGRTEDRWEAMNGSIDAVPNRDRVEAQKSFLRLLWSVRFLERPVGPHLPPDDDEVELGFLVIAKLIWAGYRVGVLGRG